MCFVWELLPCGIILAPCEFNNVVYFLWFRLLIAFIHDSTQMVWRGYMYAILLFIVAFIQSMMLHQYFHRCMVVGMRIRSALIAAVYKKVRHFVIYFLEEDFHSSACMFSPFMPVRRHLL